MKNKNKIMDTPQIIEMIKKMYQIKLKRLYLPFQLKVVLFSIHDPCHNPNTSYYHCCFFIGRLLLLITFEESI